MTTDTEALRAQFESKCKLSEPSRDDAGEYTDEVIHLAWLAYREGHAAAKAETAAAVAAERERATDVLAACIPEWDGQEAVDGGDLIRMLIGAIRAGAEERGE